MTWLSDKLRARRPPCLSEPCSGSLMKLRQCRARGPRNRYPTLDNLSEIQQTSNLNSADKIAPICELASQNFGRLWHGH
mgnify:CR=1 FL=1